MKKTSKALLLGLCALLLVGASVLGTMAYLTDSKSVTNTFTVGNVKIKLDEAKVKTDGTLDETTTARVTENEYHLMPGHEYKKDPKVTVEDGSDDCFLFVKVKNEIAALEGTPGVDTQIQGNGWTKVEGVTGLTNDETVYVYTNKTSAPVAVSANTEKPVFGKFTIAGTVSSFDGYEGKKIIVTAYAIQKDGFEGADWTALKIWEDGLGMKTTTTN